MKFSFLFYLLVLHVTPYCDSSCWSQLLNVGIEIQCLIFIRPFPIFKEFLHAFRDIDVFSINNVWSFCLTQVGKYWWSFAISSSIWLFIHSTCTYLSRPPLQQFGPHYIIYLTGLVLTIFWFFFIEMGRTSGRARSYR